MCKIYVKNASCIFAHIKYRIILLIYLAIAKQYFMQNIPLSLLKLYRYVITKTYYKTFYSMKDISITFTEKYFKEVKLATIQCCTLEFLH